MVLFQDSRSKPNLIKFDRLKIPFREEQPWLEIPALTSEDCRKNRLYTLWLKELLHVAVVHIEVDLGMAGGVRVVI